MATSKKQPTAKQLAARRKFARMAKQRAKDARARKRAENKALRLSAADVSRLGPRYQKQVGGLLGSSGRSRTSSSTTSRKRRTSRSTASRKRSVSSKRSFFDFGKRAFQFKTKGPRGKLKGTVRARTAWGAKRKVRKALRALNRPVIKNGKKLYGAAAQAVLEKRKQTANQRRNSASSGEPAKRLHQEFVGRQSRNTVSVVAVATTPADVAALGAITKLVTEREVFTFEESERVLLGAHPDRREGNGQLYVLNPPVIEANADFGKLEKIHYVVAKKHLEGGQVREWVHTFGEEGGEMPRLVTDRDGAFRIEGGSYYLTPEGIAD